MLYKKSLIVFFLSLFFVVAQAKTIVLGTTEWPPYVQNTPTYKGYAYNVVQAAFKQAGYDDVKIIFMPWMDAIAAVNSGQLDGIFPEYYTEDRTATIIYTKSFSDSPVGFYKKISSNIEFPNSDPTENLKITLDDMKQYRFGVVKDYVNLTAFDNNSDLHKVYVDSDLDNLKQLYHGAVDLIVIDKHVANYLLHSKLPADYTELLTFMNPPLENKKLYLSISKENQNAQAIVNDFNRGLKEIKKNGIFNKIIDNDAQFTVEHIA